MRAAFTLLLLLAGCAPLQVPSDAGRYFTLQHGTARFQAAQEAARQHCAKQGLAVRHLGTDTPGLSISRFECVEQR